MTGGIGLGALVVLALGHLVGALVLARTRRELGTWRALCAEKERTEAIVSFSRDGILAFDTECRYTLWNPAMVRVSGRRPEEVLGRVAFEVFPGLTKLGEDEFFHAALQGESVESRDRRYRNSETGKWAFFDTSFSPLRNEAGEVVGGLGILRDVSERRERDEAIHQANEQLTRWVADLERRNHEAELLSELGDLLQGCLDADEAYGVVTQLGRQLFPGYAGALYVHSASRNILDLEASWGDHQPQATLAPESCWALRRGRLHVGVPDRPRCTHDRVGPGASVCVAMVAQGETIGLLHVRRPDPLEEVGPEVQRLLATLSEQVALALANFALREKLRAQSIRDPLTGLFNRRYLEETLEREIHRSERGNHPMAVVAIDVDHFKQFNDIHGHEAGDAVLRALGAFFARSVRGSDIASRFGGEEFVLVLPDASLEDALRRAEELRGGAHDLLVAHRGGALGSISISAGVAAFPTHGNTPDELLRQADAAMYQAKAEGRDRIVLATGR